MMVRWSDLVGLCFFVLMVLFINLFIVGLSRFILRCCVVEVVFLIIWMVSVIRSFFSEIRFVVICLMIVYIWLFLLNLVSCCCSRFRVLVMIVMILGLLLNSWCICFFLLVRYRLVKDF